MKQFFKGICLAILAVFLVNPSAFAQAQFGAKAGLNLANMTFTGDLGDGSDPKITPTFCVGGILELPISASVGLRSGLEITGKGTKTKEDFGGTAYESSISLLYLQVPAVIAFQNDQFYIGAGPFAGFGISGKSKVKASGGGINIDESETAKFGNSEDDDISPLDVGLRMEAGVKLNNLRIGANFDLGLSDLIPKDSRDDSGKIHSTVIGISIGFMF